MDYRNIFTIQRLWIIFAVSLLVSFSVLLLVGGRIYQQAPPIPERVVSESGQEIFSRSDFQNGMDVWRRLGGMQLGSVWGHGGYLAPDWTADQLHREAVAILDRRAAGNFDIATPETQAVLKARLELEMEQNRYDPASKTITVSNDRGEAIGESVRHYSTLFGGIDAAHNSDSFDKLREAYAIPNSPLGSGLTPDEGRALTAFFWWTSWASVTHRPDDNVSYTSNWPHEPLVGNRPTPEAFIWTIISIALLIAGIGLLAWFFNREREVWQLEQAPEKGYSQKNPLDDLRLTPSMRATEKYFWVVALLFGLQILLGAVTAHYAVEGHDFYGIPLADYLPYALTRTWHTQLAISWIAVSWLAAGLYAAPLISGREMPRQKLLVDVLWVALIVVTVGSMAGEWLAIQGYIKNPVINFWFGHQGYEYLDLGRFWQWLLFGGLLFWLVLMGRNVVPAIRERRPDQHLLLLLFTATVAVGLLYGAGLLWDRQTHLSVAEYWRWWVVHLWVEGVFEVFATAWVAWVFVHMRLLNPRNASIYVMFSAMIFLGGGVLGTFHHLYFSGTPQMVLALGAVFSALEVVPLALIAFDAYDHWRIERDAPWMKSYHMPLMFFLAVAFWNLVGAGVLGFLINPPLSLYYVQGLMTTPTHGHAALFGVYGLLGLGFLIFCMRGLAGNVDAWSDTILKWVFWLLNGGLALMVFFSLLPQGLMQAHRSFSVGYWAARSPEFVHSVWMERFVWIRVPGDVVFAAGALLLLVFMVLLLRARMRPRAEASSRVEGERESG